MSEPIPPKPEGPLEGQSESGPALTIRTIHVVLAAQDVSNFDDAAEAYCVRAHASRDQADDHARRANDASARAYAYQPREVALREVPELQHLDPRWQPGNGTATRYRVESAVLSQVVRDDDGGDVRDDAEADLEARLARRLADVLHVRAYTYDSLLEEVANNLRDTNRLLQMSHALGRIAQDLGLPTDPSRQPADVVGAVRDALRERDHRIYRLVGDSVATRISLGFMEATDPSSTKASRDRLRRDLLAHLEKPDVQIAIDPSSRSVDELDLSVRASNCLLSAEIRTLGDLTRRTAAEISGIRHAGRRVLREVTEELAKLGLFLAGEAPAAPKASRGPRPARNAESKKAKP